MKRLLLTHLYQGQCLSHYWMHITAANPTAYPHDHGYAVFYKDRLMGEVKVKERRTIKVSTITDMMACMICGYDKEYLIRELKSRGITCHEDSLVYLFQFKWTLYVSAFEKAIREAHDANLAKNTQNQRNFQYQLI
jgi:hypothetical protein